MRIGVVSDMIRPNGAGVMALLGAELLTNAGHEVVVLGGAMTVELEQQLASTNFAAAGFTHDERALDGSVTATDHQAFIRSFHRWFEERVGEFSPEVLYVHNCGRLFSQLDLADLSHRVPVVHTMHDEWFFADAHYRFRSPRTGATIRTFEPGRSESVLEHRYDHLFEIPERVGSFAAVGPSWWITARAQAMFPTLRIEHIPNAVDQTLFDVQDRAVARATLGLPADHPIVLFVGNPTQERKNFAAVEAAICHLEHEHDISPIRLVVGGAGSVATGGADELISAGPLRDRLDAPTNNPLGVVGIAGPGIVIAGLDRALMASVYGAADVIVHPSVIDNLPTVPIEAGLCGTRCLASDVGGTAETIVERGDLFPDGVDAGELGARIYEAIGEAQTETAADRAARRSVQIERFGPDKHVASVLSVLTQVANGGGVNG